MFKEQAGLNRRAAIGVRKATGPILFLLIATLFLATSQATNVSLAGPEPEAMPIPTPLSSEIILSDGQLVYGPNVGSFNTETFLETQPGVLKDYSQSIECQALYYSINPKVLLTLVEMQSSLVTDPGPSPEAIEYAVQYKGRGGFQSQLEWLSEEIYQHFYWHLYVYQSNKAQIGDELDLGHDG